MLLVLLAIACVLSVPLSGGSLRRLGDIRLRAQWAAFCALVVQVLVLGLFTGGAAWWHALAHVATYALAAYFVWANRSIPGVVVIAAGGALPGSSRPARSPIPRSCTIRTCCSSATSSRCPCRSACTTCSAWGTC